MKTIKAMKKYLVSMVFALSALVMLTGCVVSEEMLAVISISTGN